MNKFNIYTGDCLDILKTLADNSIDSIVTDPPYGLSDHGEDEVVACMQDWLAGKVYAPKGKGFMGKSWDAWVPGPEVWRECFRVLKPGAYMIVFASTRTDDLMSMAIRLAGFRKHPAGAWVFGSGFPKATNLSKAFDAGSARPEDIRRSEMGEDYEPSGRGRVNYDHGSASVMNGATYKREPSTEAAKQHEGWFYGLQSLKPAMEPWLLFQKPHEGRMTDNVLKWGTGAINVDACRVATNDELRAGAGGLLSHVRDGKAYPNESTKRTGRAEMGYCGGNAEGEYHTGSDAGRWPANIIHDGSDAVVALFPESKGQQAAVGPQHGDKTSINTYGDYGPREQFEPRNDSGSAARFFTQCQHDEDDFETAQRLFYCPKASKADREEGLDGFEKRDGGMVSNTSGQHMTRRDDGYQIPQRANRHPTVKPTSLMRHLVRLITPPGGTCADPFMGSGSTGKAAMLECFNFIGIEKDADYAEISRARIEHAAKVASGELPKVAIEKPCAARYPVDTEASEVAQGVLF